MYNLNSTVQNSCKRTISLKTKSSKYFVDSGLGLYYNFECMCSSAGAVACNLEFSWNLILVYIARWTSVISEEVCDMGSYRTRRQPSVIIVYTARWTSGISEEVYNMGSYRTRRQPSVIRAHIVHFFTYLTSPRAV